MTRALESCSILHANASLGHRHTSELKRTAMFDEENKPSLLTKHTQVQQTAIIWLYKQTLCNININVENFRYPSLACYLGEEAFSGGFSTDLPTLVLELG